MHFHQVIHNLLLEYRNKIDSSFNFIVRQRTSKNKEFPNGKFAEGLVFQGTNNYCFVGIIDKSGGQNATKSVGLVFVPNNDSFVVKFEIVFPGINQQNLIEFYKELAEEFDEIEWDKKGTRAYLTIGFFKKENPELLFNWLNKYYPKIKAKAKKSHIKDLLISNDKFNSLQIKLKSKLKEIASEMNSSILKSKKLKINLKEEYKEFVNSNNKNGSQKASSYIRALDLLDNILNEKALSQLNGFISIYSINSPKTIKKLYTYILDEQKNENGIFKNEEPISYWRDKFYSAALNSYLNFLKQDDITVSNFNKIDEPFSISEFEKSCKESGLKYKPQLITRYISSLATKPFVLLSGLSGSGKTKLAQAYAQWICESEEQYCIVPVGADWTNREPLLGYVNALNNKEYILPENGALKLLIEANKEENKNKPYFLILDEMNLSHVERYFADFLSIMESKDQLKLHSDTKDKGIVSSHLNWPKNLFIVGTVNIDETTYMFSPKVLDRANVIEFRVNKEDISKFLDAPTEIDFTNLNGKGAGMGENFIEISSNKEFKNIETEELNKKLVLFFEELTKTGAEFGYRTATEIHRLYKQLTTLDNKMLEEAKIDIAIMQKLLPKLHGSRRKLCPILETLASFCVIEKTDVLKAFLNNKETIDFKTNESVLYPLSLEKITRMYKGAVDNGFASYAEA